MTTEYHAEDVQRESRFGDNEKSLESLGISADRPGQSYPRRYPHPDETLGEPLTIRETAELIGCSEWTVRHQHIPKGLPHFRSGPTGKLLFYRKQVVAWILQQQRKGGQ
jgi:hypothetical protein